MEPPQFVPIQVNTYERLAEPDRAGATLVQHTAVRMVDMPVYRDHIIWSICSLVYLNPCCLGLAALYFSVKSRDRKVAGDMDSAREYGSTARCLNIIALVLICIIVIAVIASYATIIAWFVNNHG